MAKMSFSSFTFNQFGLQTSSLNVKVSSPASMGKIAASPALFVRFFTIYFILFYCLNQEQKRCNIDWTAFGSRVSNRQTIPSLFLLQH